QNRTPASVVLNRENQRRSRARRRELFDDLQRKVLEYESRDAQATIEMQRVARTVAAENAALRELLAARHVTREEVEHHLAMSSRGVTHGATSQPRSWPLIKSRPSKQAMVGSPWPQKTGSLPSHTIMSCSTFPEQHYLPAQSPEVAQIATPTPSSPALSTRPVAISAQPASGHVRPLRSNGMHCVEAATILARLRGDSDATIAHAKLGCAEGTDCVVQNTDVLRLMDEIT
ncbi:hypothetical protein BGZ63DRAFT_365554, partial [Mariannaea sp. PMI_226]